MTMLTKSLQAACCAAALLAPGLASAEDLQIGLPTSPPNIVHMPVVIANELGLYKKYGISVKLVSLNGGVNVYRAMLAGNIDVGTSPATASIVARSKGSPSKMILANLIKYEASMVVRDNIQKPADLKGKRIGIQEPGGFADILSRSVLRAAKVDPKEVNFVTIATEDVPALVANQVDTAILHVEQEALAQQKVPTLHVIQRIWDVQPKTLYTVSTVTEKTIHDKPAQLLAFVKANIEATRLLYTDKAKVLPVIIKATGYPPKVVEQGYDLLVKNCIWDANSGLGRERIDFTADLMTKVGNIAQGKTPKYEDIVDLSFAQQALKDLGEWKGPVCPTAAF